MPAPRTTVALLCATLVLFGSVGPMFSAAQSAAPDEFAVTQGGACVTVQPFGDGSSNVSEFYDYRRPDTDPEGDYSSYGTTDLQENQVTSLFLFHGSEGVSLVVLHDQLDDAPGGSTVTFTFRGLPENGGWIVRDDYYGNGSQDDDWNLSGSVSTIDWKWAPDRTDGGAYRGLGNLGSGDAINITPEFNEDADHWEDWGYTGDGHRVERFQLIDSDESTVQLSMNDTLTIQSGACAGSTPSPTPTASPNGTPTATPNGTPTATPNGTPTATPNGTPPASPNGTPTMTPTDTPTEAPSGGGSSGGGSSGGGGYGGGYSGGYSEPVSTPTPLPPPIPTRVAVGDAVAGLPTTVTAEFRDVGRYGGSLDATMSVADEQVGTKRVAIPADGTVEVTFEHTFESVGTRSIDVNGRTATVTVQPATANLTVDRLVVDRPSIRAGETATVVATVRNHGTVEGTTTLELEAFGDVVGRETVTVAAGEGRSVTFDQQFAAPGTYTLRVNGHEATVEVAAATTDPERESPPTTGESDGAGGPDVGFPLAVLALTVLAALAALRR